ncbi:MAG: hypothetical protein ACJ746_10665 [Bryobacteraceae bacterium]
MRQRPSAGNKYRESTRPNDNYEARPGATAEFHGIVIPVSEIFPE